MKMKNLITSELFVFFNFDEFQHVETESLFMPCCWRKLFVCIKDAGFQQVRNSNFE